MLYLASHSSNKYQPLSASHLKNLKNFCNKVCRNFFHYPPGKSTSKEDFGDLRKVTREDRKFRQFYKSISGHEVAQWLRRYATNRKVTGSIPDEVNF
jgi:hypothetical protein